jgi:hypothetical protein
MTLNDYLNSLSDEERIAFVKRVEAVGNQTVDVFSEALPKWYDPEASSMDVNSVYAVHKHEGPSGSSHFHLLLLDYQYAYWENAERKPAKPTKSEDPDPKDEKPENDVKIVASKADKKFFKATAKADGSTEDGPLHVFGSSLYDPDKRVFIFPGTQKKQPIDVGAKPIEVGKEETKA